MIKHKRQIVTRIKAVAARDLETRSTLGTLKASAQIESRLRCPSLVKEVIKRTKCTLLKAW